jgi:hypothetical protein
MPLIISLFQRELSDDVTESNTKLYSTIVLGDEKCTMTVHQGKRTRMSQSSNTAPSSNSQQGR